MTTEQFVAAFTAAVATYSPHVVFLVALVVVDFITGVAAAIKTNTFSWSKIGNTYRTTLVPKVLGWFGVTLGLAVATPAIPYVADAAPIITGLGANGLFVVTIGDLVASIAKSVTEIRA